MPNGCHLALLAGGGMSDRGPNGCHLTRFVGEKVSNREPFDSFCGEESEDAK